LNKDPLLRPLWASLQSSKPSLESTWPFLVQAWLPRTCVPTCVCSKGQWGTGMHHGKSTGT
jgi:hypothetical protein